MSFFVGLRASINGRRTEYGDVVKRQGDEQLVQLAVQGDKDAYRQLVEQYQSRALSLAFGILKNREDAEDIVQESFVKAYLSLPNFKGDSSFYTWLYRIVVNMAIDQRRRVARTGGEKQELNESLVAENAFGTVAMVAPEPHEALERKETATQIQQALSELSPEHRAVIILREVDGLSYEEIADVVRVSKGTVMSRLHYARKRVQEVLQQLWDAEAELGKSALGKVALNSPASTKAAI